MIYKKNEVAKTYPNQASSLLMSTKKRWKPTRGQQNVSLFKENITLPETNIATENGWLEDDPFLLGRLPGRCYVRFQGG